MQLTYRGRMILYNIILYFTTCSIITFLIIQGITFYYINNSKSTLELISHDAILYINQEVKVNARMTTLEKTYENQSLTLVRSIAQLENCRVLLYNSDALPLADSLSNVPADLLSEEAVLTTKVNAPVFSLRNTENGRMAYYMAPLSINDVTVGYIGLIYSLNSLDALLNMCFLLLIVAFVFGLIILIVMSLSYSNHFIQPIRDLTKISNEINKGNYNVTIHYRRDDEIGDLTKVFNQMSLSVNNAIVQIESERKRLASVLASIDDGLLAIDKQGNIITSNSYIKTYFNVSNPKTIYDFQFQSFLRDMFDDLRGGKGHISEEIDSNDRNLLIIGSPIRVVGFEENYLIIIRNITSTKQIESERKKFISSVSHELRTPLTTIIGYTDMLTRRHVLDPEILERSLGTINQEGHRLLRLVDDLLTVNRFEKVEFDVKKTNVNLHTLILDVVEQMQIKASPNNIEITYKSDEQLPEVFGDYDRLRQMFINIIHNAIKYSDNGDLIDVISTQENDHVVISIRDYGVGISSVEQERIFNAFYRVEEDRARSEGEGGAGLGLYLVKQIVEKHDGTLKIDSQVGEGTNIIVRLPIIQKLIKEADYHEA